MEKMSAEIVSEETIRPSSLTPPHLRIYKLSLLDQLGALFYVPVTLFYSIDDHDTNFDLDKAVEQLKHSLSETLAVFYPLAGRTRDHLSIDCNDEGVQFSVAKVELHLQQYLNNPNLDLLPLFAPSLEIAPTQQNLNSAVPALAVQVTVFRSGGFAIGLRFLHQITDGSTFAAFLNVWAAITSGRTRSSEIKPDFMAASVHFPPLEETLGEDMMLLDMNWIRKKEKSVRSRVVFDAKAISALKARAASEEGGENPLPSPTRYEVVTSLIWKHAMLASSSVSLCGCDAKQQQQPSMMMVPVNMRPRTDPPMDENAIGSNVWMALAHQSSTTKLEELGISSLGGKIRGAVKKLVTDLAIDKDPLSTIKRQIKETKTLYAGETPDAYTSSSWCSFPFYEVDFGWGKKPAWVAFTWRVSTIPMYVNGMILMDNKTGGGVEAWLLLGENHTARLFSDAEFLRFASVNPSIATGSGQEQPSATDPKN